MDKGEIKLIIDPVSKAEEAKEVPSLDLESDSIPTLPETEDLDLEGPGSLGIPLTSDIIGFDVGSDIKLKDLLSHLSPLDIIYFKGTDFVSNTIMKIEEFTTGESDWSHVGLVVNRDLLPGVEAMSPDRWYIWESVLSSGFFKGTDGVLDISTGKGFFGTQIRDLEDVVEAYTANCGKVGWGKLINNPWHISERSKRRLRQKFNKIHQKYCYVNFDVNPLSCFGAAFPLFRRPRDIIDRIVYRVDYDKYLEEEIENINLGLTDPSELDPSGTETIDYSRVKGTVRSIRSTNIPEGTPADLVKIIKRAKKKGINVRSAINDVEKPKMALICSEMIALFFRFIGLIEQDPRNVMPVDFYSNNDDEGLKAVTYIPIEIIPEQ